MTAEQMASLTSSSPVVCLDRLPEDLEVDSVCVDDRGAAKMAVSHLISKGHSEIAIVTGPLTLHNEQERLSGYRQALEEAGIGFQASLVWGGSFEENEVARLCQKGVQRPAGRPSALFATNGVTGLAALRSLYAVGLSTPKDFSFVTFDELTAEDFFKPGITSVVQPTFEMGHRAVEVLLKRIDAVTPGTERKMIRLPATLVERESSNAAYRPGGSSGNTTR